MPAFTPIDLISALASLNRGDVEGFRQPFSAEGRQQRLTERGLKTQDLAQQQALMEWFRTLHPSELPPALAQRMSSAQTKTAEQLQPFAMPMAQEELKKAQTLGPFVGPTAQAGLESTKAGTAGQQAQTQALLDSIRRGNEAEKSVATPGIQELLQKFLGAPATTPQMPLGVFSALEPGARSAEAAKGQEKAHQLSSLTQLLMTLGFTAPQEVPAALSRIGTLSGAEFGKTKGTAKTPFQELFQQWQQQQSSGKTTSSSTPKSAARRLVSGEGLSNAIVNASTGPAYTQAQQMATTPNVAQSIIPGEAIPAGATIDELRQAMAILQMLNGPTAPAQEPAPPPPQAESTRGPQGPGALPDWFYRLLGERN